MLIEEFQKSSAYWGEVPNDAEIALKEMHTIISRLDDSLWNTVEGMLHENLSNSQWEYIKEIREGGCRYETLINDIAKYCINSEAIPKGICFKVNTIEKTIWLMGDLIVEKNLSHKKELYEYIIA